MKTAASRALMLALPVAAFAVPAMAQTVTDPFTTMFDDMKVYIPFVIAAMVGIGTIKFAPLAVRWGIKMITGFARG